MLSIIVSLMESFYEQAKLANKWFVVVILKSSLRKFTVATLTWLTVTEYLCRKCPRICYFCRNHNPVLSSFITYHWVRNNSNTTCATIGAETAYTPGAHEFAPVLLLVLVGSCCSCCSFCQITCFHALSSVL